MTRGRSLALLAGGASLLLTALARAQPPDGPEEPESPEGAEPAAVAPAPAADLADRLQRLEERDAERERALEAALSRVDDLERAAAAPEAPAEAETVEAETAEAEVVPAPPSDPGPSLRPIGSMMTRFELREGYADLGAGNPGCFPGANDGDCLRYRARLGLEVGNLRVGDDLVAAIRFAPQVTGFWSFGTPATSGGVVHPTLALYEGNFVLQVGDGVRFDIGRIVLNYGDQRVLGALGWHPAARSFDGARVHIQPDADGFWMDAFWTMIGEGGPGGFGNAETTFYGIYAGLGPLLGPGAGLDVYALALQSNDRADPTTGNAIGWSFRAHLGGRFQYRVDLVDLRAEAGLQVGRAGQTAPAGAVPIVAGHVDAEVGFNLLDDRLRLGLLGFFASGDDPSTEADEAYAQLFPTGHAFLGFTDVMGARTNAAGAAARVLGAPIPELRLGLDVHVFARPESGGVQSYAGTEADLQVIWLVGSGFRLRGMYGVFLPDPGQWGAGADTVHYVELELLYQTG